MIHLSKWSMDAWETRAALATFRCLTRRREPNRVLKTLVAKRGGQNWGLEWAA